MSSKPKAKRPTVGKRKKKQASDYEACATANTITSAANFASCSARPLTIGSLAELPYSRPISKRARAYVVKNPSATQRYSSTRAGYVYLLLTNSVCSYTIGLENASNP